MWQCLLCISLESMMVAIGLLPEFYFMLRMLD